MDEERKNPNTEEPREVVLRYAPPDPREVVERFAPEDARRRLDTALDVAERQSRLCEELLDEIQFRRARRRGLPLFWRCFLPLVALSLTLGLFYWRGILPRAAKSAGDAYEYRFENGRSKSYDAYADIETAIPRYPTGGDTRFTYAAAHGAALDVREIYARVNPSTVTVATALPGGGAIVGTGVIFTEDGYILTNAHVVAGGEQCYVVLDTGRSFSNVKLVGYDVEQDLAIIKVDAHGLPAAEFGDSDALWVGDTVYAIGNPLGVELRGTLTDGIISAVSRDVRVDGVKMTLLQTSAALNNGNSGGPLINIYGQVVGINTMKMGSSNAASVEGLGFAIPVSSAAWMINDLIAHGEIGEEPVLGIVVLLEPMILSSGEASLAIEEITPDGPAEKAGLLRGDLILSADGEPVESLSDLLRIRRRFCSGEALTLGIERDGERFPVDVTLTPLDE